MVVVGQVLGGAGLAAGVTVGALLAQQMLGTKSAAGLPAALFTLGSAMTAYLVGALSQRAGRRVGLGLGFSVGALGAAGVVVAAALGSVPLLFATLFVYGAGTATNLQARYAGADLADPARRGTAISIALVSTTFGAVAGPNLVAPLGGLAERLSLPALAGPFLLAAAAYSCAGAVLFTLLRPDPLLFARRLERETAGLARAADRREATCAPSPGILAPSTEAGAYLGAAVMVLTQVSMAAVMTMTPVHMRTHHRGLDDVGLVIGLHIAAMFLPSLVTGRLADRWGRTAMVVASGAALLVAGVTAATAPGESLGFTILALVLLGFGWNLGLISGTALVVDATEPANRPKVQGSIDVLVALAGAAGGASSGLMVSATSYSVLALAAGLLALALVPAVMWAAHARSLALDDHAGVVQP